MELSTSVQTFLEISREAILLLLVLGVLVRSGCTGVCFGGGQRAVAFLPLLPHSAKRLYTDVL